MRALTALIKREFIEHRGAFFFVPLGLLTTLTLGTFYGLLTANFNPDAPMFVIGFVAIYHLAVAGAFAMWSTYALIGLFFYYADSFSADRRDNALLFWKSMPQSDLKVLTSKSLSGITIFPALLTGFAFLSSVLIYAAIVLAAARIPFVRAPTMQAATWGLLEVGAIGTLYLFLSILWMAPFLAWVAGLSTLFRRWSMPLAILVPVVVVMFEWFNSLGGMRGSRPIADFLWWRLQGIVDAEQVIAALIQPDGSGPAALLDLVLENVDWLHLGLGLVFTVMVVYVASEYRRRRIAA